MFLQQISTLHRARCRLLRPQYFSSQPASTTPEEHRVQVERYELLSPNLASYGWFACYKLVFCFAECSWSAFPLKTVGSSCSVDDGFIIDEIRVRGAVVAHGSLWMMWKADSAAAITREHLSILELIRPAPELLVVGCGEHHETLPKETMKWLRSTGTSVEVLPTVCICASAAGPIPQ